MLIIRPGFLTKEFFAGRRARYAPPIRFYIFASFILFLLLQINTTRGLNEFLTNSLNESEAVLKMDSVLAVASDSVVASVNKNADSDLSRKLAVLDSSDHILTAIDYKAIRNEPNIRASLINLSVQLESLLENETDPEKRARLINYIRLCRSPEQALARGLKYMSWAFFMLLPVFALILWLFYFRRNQYFIRHLIFSIHFHSYVFIVFILLTSVYIVFERTPGWLTFLMFFSVPVYLIVALKKFYGQGVMKVILKFLGISFIYNIIFLITVGIVFFNALNIL